MKQKKVKNENIKIGTRVVVNSLPDTYVYTIDEIDGFNVRLSYMSGEQKYSAGWIDRSYLLVPTEAQLNFKG